jgi:hypothetical protein
MHKEAFEPTGLIPRSIIRTFDRFRQQLLPGTEQIAIQEYRISRYQILVSIKALCTLIFVPFLVTYTVKFFLITPVTEHFWDYQQGDIFLNSYQEKRAFNEMHDFSEKIFFESLVNSNDEEDWATDLRSVTQTRATLELGLAKAKPFFNFNFNKSFADAQNLRFCERKARVRVSDSIELELELPSKLSEARPGPVGLVGPDSSVARVMSWGYRPPVGCPSRRKEAVLGVQDRLVFTNQDEVNTLNLQIRFQTKSLEIAETYNKQSILAITCLLGDFVTLLTLYILFVLPQMKPQVIILKSFLTESLYSLSDTTKSFLLILGMDLLVGFHSPRGWEIFLESALRHFGLPENESFILLFVALFPVFLDTVFKYWIFRYLNKISPSTVVTYHSMLE